MHIFFSGIGGAGIGPLSMIARQAGYQVSGSDKQDSQYISYLKKQGITDIHIGQTRENIAAVHDRHAIDWYVYSSALEIENPHHPELAFTRNQNIKTSKRDELINQILIEKNLKMIAVAGTHGKTTTTAMVVWLMKQLGVTFSYLLPAKTSFGDMGQYQAGSEYFVYECDEFDRNFLAFEPYLSLITGVSWDHHEIFPTREDYQQAFQEFITQSRLAYLWFEDLEYLNFNPNNIKVLESGDHAIENIELAGLYNRLDAWLAIKAINQLTKEPIAKLIELMNNFPGLQRRMEQIIRGAMSVATEMAAKKGQSVVVVYEPLTNRRQFHILHDYGDCFAGAAKLYWLPSYLAREDPTQRIIPPEELISHLADPSIAKPRQRDASLKQTIQNHLKDGDMVVAMAGGGGNSLDEWVRKEFKN
jgi:UDP-N-acetylmuramate--alanine ligase